MTARRATVFGGAGFLGSYVADALADGGYQVVVFDKVASPHLRSGQIGIVGDILDPVAVAAAIEGSSVVYNYAGIADIDEASKDPIETVRINILGNTILLEAARRAKVERFVFASTLYVYSSAGAFYRSTKQACELIIEDYQKAHGLAYTILRYGSLYGPRAGATNGIGRIVSEAVTSGCIERVGTGDEVREYIHVWDAARSSVDVLAKEYENSHVMISGQQSIRVGDLLSMIRSMLGGNVTINYREPDKTSAGATAHYDVSPYAFNPKVARKIIRTSYVDLGQGLLDLIQQAYRERHHLKESGGILVTDDTRPVE
jgi:UDP-glucose 4-epimerase